MFTPCVQLEQNNSKVGIKLHLASINLYAARAKAGLASGQDLQSVAHTVYENLTKPSIAMGIQLSLTEGLFEEQRMTRAMNAWMATNSIAMAGALDTAFSQMTSTAANLDAGVSAKMTQLNASIQKLLNLKDVESGKLMSNVTTPLSSMSTFRPKQRPPKSEDSLFSGDSRREDKTAPTPKSDDPKKGPVDMSDPKNWVF